MTLTEHQDRQLQTIITLVEKFRKEAAKVSADKMTPRGRRRSAADAAKMRKDILAARAKGVAATKLAAKYGVSTAYIYMIKG